MTYNETVKSILKEIEVLKNEKENSKKSTIKQQCNKGGQIKK